MDIEGESASLSHDNLVGESNCGVSQRVHDYLSSGDKKISKIFISCFTILTVYIDVKFLLYCSKQANTLKLRRKNKSKDHSSYRILVAR